MLSLFYFYFSIKANIEDLYCFNYSASNEHFDKEDGWNRFTFDSEFERMGCPNNSWVLSTVNQNYEVFEDYIFFYFSFNFCLKINYLFYNRFAKHIRALYTFPILQRFLCFWEALDLGLKEDFQSFHIFITTMYLKNIYLFLLLFSYEILIYFQKLESKTLLFKSLIKILNFFINENKTKIY
jgi:hypothetical protein